MKSLLDAIKQDEGLVEGWQYRQQYMKENQKKIFKGYLTKKELTDILKYKAPRAERHWKRFDEKDAILATQSAFSSLDRPIDALMYLDNLPGVAVPSASAVLAWTTSNFAVIDQRSWRTICYFGLAGNRTDGLGLQLKNYEFFLNLCREVASEINKEVHWIDLWLYFYDKRYLQNKGTSCV